MRNAAMLGMIALALAPLAAAADARVDQARGEGEIVWYTAMNVPDAEAVRKPFLERYPFLKLTLVRAPGEKVRLRILMEARAARFAWDVVSFNLLDVAALNREGLLAAYVSPETKSGGFPPGAVDPAGRWAAIYVRQYVIGYNTQLVKAAEAPKSWRDLLAPRWAGKFALDEGDIEWYAAMLDYWGHDKGVAYMRALAGQKPQQRRGHQLLTRLLSAGEFPLALVHANEVEEDKRHGAPVEWVKTLDPTITSPSEAAISAKAPHPAAARLFMDFLLSKEGQTAIRSRGRVPARTDLEGESRDAALTVFYVDPRLAPRFANFEAEFHSIFDKAR
ncbi:MAG TPA: extracellular solute-binding protein [Burkholderiales bacterium]|nr:extracellular solute-binding protein [Burkholderiales bacterium]